MSTSAIALLEAAVKDQETRATEVEKNTRQEREMGERATRQWKAEVAKLDELKDGLAILKAAEQRQREGAEA